MQDTDRGNIPVIGTGLGEAAAAALLIQAGFTVDCFEKAPAFDRLGAGIHIGPNVMKIFRTISPDDRLAAIGSRPSHWFSRDGMTGDDRSRIELGAIALREDGAPYITLHRGDMHAEQISALAAKMCISTTASRRSSSVRRMCFRPLSMGGRSCHRGDAINSMIREVLLGPEMPGFSGRVGHRALVNMEKRRATGLDQGTCVKWWWDGSRHIMA